MLVSRIDVIDACQLLAKEIENEIKQRLVKQDATSSKKIEGKSFCFQ
jgi:hypothetical protein